MTCTLPRSVGRERRPVGNIPDCAAIGGPYRGVMRRILGIAAAVGAAGTLLIALVTAKWYFWDIVVGQAGNPDRSMLFWGLPILFIGVASAAVSVALALAARWGLTTR